jgi:hypothetical protein
MRLQAKERGKIKWTGSEAKKSWAELIPEELWEDLGEKLNFSSEYPKGTPTVARHITYQSFLNKLAEEIRLSPNSFFRTDTEIFRVTIHLGMGILYNIFCRDRKCIEESRGYFFYKALRGVEREMERATVISVINEKRVALNNLVKNRSMTKENAQESLNKLVNALPKADQQFVRDFFNRPKVDNVVDITDEMMKDSISL